MDVARILLPVKGGLVDDQTLKLASRLVRQDHGSIIALYVIEVLREYPLDVELPEETRRGEQVLRHVEDTLHRHKCKVSAAELVQARDAGAAVVREAIERSADMILVGLPYKRRHGAFSMGQAVPYILENAPCQVLVLREPGPAEPPAKADQESRSVSGAVR
jgi:nucleotide-binding universal stress UspA family protein